MKRAMCSMQNIFWGGGDLVAIRGGFVGEEMENRVKDDAQHESDLTSHH